MNHRVFDRIDAVVGEQMWNFADFTTTSGIIRVGGKQERCLHPGPSAQGAAHALRRRWREASDSAVRSHNREEASAMWTLSGFSDEIPPDFTEQCSVVSSLGLKYLEFRSAWNITSWIWTMLNSPKPRTSMRIPYG